MKSFVIFLIFFVSFGSSRLFEGQCRSRPAPVVTSFDFSRYLGVWYEMEWYDDEYPTDDECIKFTYTPTGFGSFDFLLESKHANDSFRYESFKGHGVEAFPDEKLGQLNTTYGKGPPKRVNYEILATDYDNFSFVWDCHNVNNTFYNEKFWYFSRDFRQSERPKVVDDLLKEFFDPQFIRKTYHGPKCFISQKFISVVNTLHEFI
ncbi:apolipoprotein D-like [Culicoides brevitarsis]|uniref:apolipoprotein D-like n=1 Tax=Culicoides brevitarsis TaxID=469753 RepID=UPI00307B9342